MTNQPINEGEALKNFLRGTGKQMQFYADKLKMTRQNLNYHLRKDVLDGDFSRLVEKSLRISLSGDVFSKWKMENGKHYSHTDVPATSEQWSPSTIHAEDYGRVKEHLKHSKPSAHRKHDETSDDIVKRYRKAFLSHDKDLNKANAYRAIVNMSMVDTIVDLMFRVDRLEGYTE